MKRNSINRRRPMNEFIAPGLISLRPGIGMYRIEHLAKLETTGHRKLVDTHLQRG